MMITDVFNIVISKYFITNYASRITKKDLLIVEEIIDECNMDFENESLDEMDKI